MQKILSLISRIKFSALTSYFSITFLVVFLPLCLGIYIILPQKARKYWLLTASLGFFWLISGKLTAVLVLTIVSVYLFGLWLGKLRKRRDAEVKAAEKTLRKEIKKAYLKKTRLVLLLAAVLHIGTLLAFKYTAFFTVNINSLLSAAGAETSLAVPHIITPIGISFFTLQAVSYLFDVYRETIEADRNIFRLGLFMAFFPQIVEGPICRYSQTARQLWSVGRIEHGNLTMGLQRILFGLMKKLVIADRLNAVIESVFYGYSAYDGAVTAFAAICYTVQLYMEFSGTMDAANGVSQIFGVTMPENFQRPFFSRSISEFWKRWHITLGTWFKDYVFYPVTMSKPMKKLTSSARKKLGNHFGPLIAGAIALFCVWSFNGLWHGSAWSYIFFGMYHFVLILLGNIISPGAKWVQKKLHIDPEKLPYKIFQIVRTCILVVFGELFFRADGLKAGLFMFKNIFTNFHISSLSSQLMSLRIDAADLIIAAVTIVIVLAVSIINEKGISIRNELSRRSVVLRWAVIYALILFVVIFGAYGVGYVPVDPIYAQF